MDIFKEAYSEPTQQPIVVEHKSELWRKQEKPKKKIEIILSEMS